jgi:hypothetical protein
MPYRNHPAVDTPPNALMPTWRFLDFTKFVDLLVTSKLYFARLSVLSDPLEGFLGKRSLEWIRTRADFNGENDVQNYLAAMRRSRESLFVSCWHMNEHESAAMWRLYLKSDEGIAVRSTIQRMTEAFELAKQDVYLGKMYYNDFDSQIMVPGNVLRLAFVKRRSFEHEREVRALVSGSFSESDNTPSGLSIEVDLPRLIERVYVAPGSPDWLLALVENVTHRFGLGIPIVRSSLDEQPLY